MLEKADQYFELKNHVGGMDEIMKDWCVPEDKDTREELVGKLKNDERFNKLDEEDIHHALNALNDEFQYERFRHNAAYIINDEKWDWDGEEVIDLELKDVDKAKILQKFPFFNPDCNVLEIDGYVTSDPIYTLALQTRIKDRVLHRKPEVELKKLKKSYPFYYYDFFIAEEQKYKEKTVTFTYNDCDASAEDIKDSLSSNGEILTVYNSRFDSQSQMAHVTFKDVSTATSVLGLAAQGQLKMGGRPVGVIPTTYNEVPRGLPACKPEHVKAAMFAVEKMEEELLSDARRKYAMLVEKLNGSNVHGRAKRHKTEPELPDDVMSE